MEYMSTYTLYYEHASNFLRGLVTNEFLAPTVVPLQSLLPSLPQPSIHHPSPHLPLPTLFPSPSPSFPYLPFNTLSLDLPFTTLSISLLLFPLSSPISHLRLWHWREVCSVQDTALWRTCTEGEYQSRSQTSRSFSLVPRPPTPSQSHSQTSHSFTVSFPDLPLFHSLIPRLKTNLQCVYHVQYHWCTCHMRSGDETTYYL